MCKKTIFFSLFFSFLHFWIFWDLGFCGFPYFSGPFGSRFRHFVYFVGRLGTDDFFCPFFVPNLGHNFDHFLPSVGTRHPEVLWPAAPRETLTVGPAISAEPST
jgi:hypothetical protein